MYEDDAYADNAEHARVLRGEEAERQRDAGQTALQEWFRQQERRDYALPTVSWLWDK